MQQKVLNLFDICLSHNANLSGTSLDDDRTPLFRNLFTHNA